MTIAAPETLSYPVIRILDVNNFFLCYHRYHAIYVKMQLSTFYLLLLKIAFVSFKGYGHFKLRSPILLT